MESPPYLPTGTVTFLFTDIEGSTRLAQEYPDTWEVLRNHHNTILRNAIESHHGYVFRIIRDAFCAAFDTAGEAVLADLVVAGAACQSLGRAADQGTHGVHTGQAEIQPDGEYLGYL